MMNINLALRQAKKPKMPLSVRTYHLFNAMIGRNLVLGTEYHV